MKLIEYFHIAENHHNSITTPQSWVVFAQRYVVCQAVSGLVFDGNSKTVKKSAKVIIERYYPKLTLDFETNKRICDEIAIIASKRLRNKVGFNITSLEHSNHSLKQLS